MCLPYPHLPFPPPSPPPFPPPVPPSHRSFDPGAGASQDCILNGPVVTTHEAVLSLDVRSEAVQFSHVSCVPVQEAHKSLILVKAQSKQCGKELIDNVKHSEEVSQPVYTLLVLPASNYCISWLFASIKLCTPFLCQYLLCWFYDFPMRLPAAVACIHKHFLCNDPWRAII